MGTSHLTDLLTSQFGEIFLEKFFFIDNIISYNECIAFPRHGKDGRIKGICQKATFCFTKLPLEADIDLSSLA